VAFDQRFEPRPLLLAAAHREGVDPQRERRVGVPELLHHVCRVLADRDQDRGERVAGDIDSLAIAPTGVAFVVETKTRTYNDRHLARVREQAAWLLRRRRRWCRRGAVPVVCLVHTRGIERVEREVLVVSLDRLIPVLESAAIGLGLSANELGMRGRIGQRRRLE
jgi:hypothetical protein